MNREREKKHTKKIQQQKQITTKNRTEILYFYISHFGIVHRINTVEDLFYFICSIYKYNGTTIISWIYFDRFSFVKFTSATWNVCFQNVSIKLAVAIV